MAVLLQIRDAFKSYGDQVLLDSAEVTWKYISPGATGHGKAAKNNVKGKPAAEPQLYNLKTDLAEEQNLAESRPDKLNEMRTLLDKIRGAN